MPVSILETGIDLDWYKRRGSRWAFFIRRLTVPHEPFDISPFANIKPDISGYDVLLSNAYWGDSSIRRINNQVIITPSPKYDEKFYYRRQFTFQPSNGHNSDETIVAYDFKAPTGKAYILCGGLKSPKNIKAVFTKNGLQYELPYWEGHGIIFTQISFGPSIRTRPSQELAMRHPSVGGTMSLSWNSL